MLTQQSKQMIRDYLRAVDGENIKPDLRRLLVRKLISNCLELEKYDLISKVKYYFPMLGSTTSINIQKYHGKNNTRI